MKKSLLLLTVLASFYSVALADASLGGMANAALAPVVGVGKILSDLSIVAGIGLLFGSVVQYRAHRENPTQVRLSTPVFLIIAGAALILLPFIGAITHYAPVMVTS